MSTSTTPSPQPLVSVIIPTYNRFNYLLNAVASVKAQTYPNVEIIIVNDCSTQPEYYTNGDNPILKGCNILHLAKNSKETFGFACAGFVRNKGFAIAEGEYIAILDDDDCWIPNKLEIQISEMIKSQALISSTDAFTGNGAFDPSKEYPIYINQLNFDYTINRFIQLGKSHLLNNNPITNKKSIPAKITHEMLYINNVLIASSVVISKKLMSALGGMKHVKNADEDFDYWLRATKITPALFIQQPLIYYDQGHGDGRLY